ncbi:Hypothetical predicted protein [Olea europaea subsp. europaea]|uniref:Uncharacterized protein n=1 Tax=Olea europaea subsp. europaea TaxID=158383 RepID=A0A8S0TW81_OLEEU|nr:Hypothetical predicted protein [Olea europaea subsp. europaea]
MSGSHLGRGRDRAWFPGISRQFLGHGHVWDTFGPHQGRSLIFRHFWKVMFETRSGHSRGRAYFQVILGSFWARFTGHVRDDSLPGHIQDASGPWQGQSLFSGYVRDASWPGQGWSLIFRQFRVVFGHDVLAMSETPPGQVGTQPDFQAFLGSLWVRCAGQVRDAS